MKNAKHHLWHHYRETPFEVMSIILFSALAFGGAGTALADEATKDSKVHHVQAALAQHASAVPSVQSPSSRHV